MRILHTSDWHLGQNFYSKKPRGRTRRFFLPWLLDRAQEHEVDAIIVAGDIFDTGSPPSYARELYNRFVVQLQQTGCRPVVLAGNHDSVAMLNESRDILAFYTPPWWRTPATRRLSCRCATARRAPSSVRCRFTPARAGDQPAGHPVGKTAAAAARHQRLLSGAVSAGLRAARRSAAAHHCQRPSDHRRRQQKRCRPRHLHRHTGCLSGATLPLPTTLRWAIFTGRRWSAAASISATAARRCR